MKHLTKQDLETLIDHPRTTCVSLFMPTHRTAPETQQDPIRLKNLLATAQERLEATDMRPTEGRDFLEPARKLIDDEIFWEHQSDGLALFLSGEGLLYYRLPREFEERVTVNDHFYVKPLLPVLAEDGRFYVLALSQNEIRLLQGSRYRVGEVTLRGVPESLAEALAWDDPQSQLQLHTSSSSFGKRSGGRPGAVFHGHGDVEEDDKENVRRYLKKIARGVGDVLGDANAPLVLAGVDWVCATYRAVNGYAPLLDDIVAGNPEELSADQLHDRAWELVRPVFARKREEQADLFRQSLGTGKASADVEEVVAATHHGRVGTLFVTLDRDVWGRYDPDADEVVVHEEEEEDDEDLLDLAAIQTIRNGGEVHAVEPDEVPAEDSPVAAIYRY